MKNLYVYCYNGLMIDKEVWKDVKQTRDGKVVRKRNSDYDISMGNYVKVEQLNQYEEATRGRYGSAERKLEGVIFRTFEEDSFDIDKFIDPFIEEKRLEIERKELELKQLNEGMDRLINGKTKRVKEEDIL